MAIKHAVLRSANFVLKPLGLTLSGRGVLASRSVGPSYERTPLPEGAEEYLRTDHPRLTQIRQEYRAFASPVTTPSVWTEGYLKKELALGYFRGDNAYVWQRREGNVEASYLATAQYHKATDRLGLYERLTDDGLFGVHQFPGPGNRLVTRDLLDSIGELNFLDRHLQLARKDRLRILDIGAGYGRLAHRTVQAWPNLERYLCVDAIPESTFLCEYYLHFRHIDDKATAILLPEIDHALAATTIDVAINVHSFTEMPLEAVSWWLDLLQKHRVPYLMIVPTFAPEHGGTKILSRETDGRKLDAMPVLEKHGYTLKIMEAKYLDPAVQKLGVSPTHHFLFALKQ